MDQELSSDNAAASARLSFELKSALPGSKDRGRVALVGFVYLCCTLAVMGLLRAVYSYAGCDDCCRPDCSGGRGCGIYMEWYDSQGRLYCGCKPSDYLACYFGGSCQTCPEDECPPGSSGGDGMSAGGGGGGSGAKGFDRSWLGGGGASGCSGCGGGGGGHVCSGEDSGVPAWWVSEPGLTLWLKATPMAYQPSRWSAVRFTLFCRNNAVGALRDEAVSGLFGGLGQLWNTPWISYVKKTSTGSWALYNGSGGAIPFHGFSTTDDASYISGWRDYRQRFTTHTQGGYRTVEYINGAKDVFSYAVTDASGNTRYFMTSRTDPHGDQLTFSYSQTNGVVYLLKVTDPDNHEVTFG